MGATVFAASTYDPRKQIWMKDIGQMGMMDENDYGWPKTPRAPDSAEFFNIGGFAFSKVDPYPPKMYFGVDNSLSYMNYPSYGMRTVIKTGYVGKPKHLDVQNEGEQDVIFFCTREGYYKYNFQTNAEKKILTFGE